MHPSATPRHNPTSWPQQRLGERVLGSFTLERLLAVGTQGAAFIARQDGTPRRAVLICRSVAVAAHRAGLSELAAVASSAQRAVIAEDTTPQALRQLLSPLIESLRVVHTPPAS